MGADPVASRRGNFLCSMVGVYLRKMCASPLLDNLYTIFYATRREEQIFGMGR